MIVTGKQIQEIAKYDLPGALSLLAINTLMLMIMRRYGQKKRDRSILLKRM